jgi:prepilin-type N-terminal cleavage/methylation domain-containing protein
MSTQFREDAMAINNSKGFTLIETLVAALLFSVIAAAGSMVLIVSSRSWHQTDTRLSLEENLLLCQQRISGELQESGQDEDGNWKVTILDNMGVNNSDILRFSVPICPCGTTPLDENSNVKAWGAPLSWGQAGCSDHYTIEQNGKVDICHVPPGNPENTNTLNVSVNAVKAHLSHGDWLGECDSCDPLNYTNRFIEYKIDDDARLVRRVLDSGYALVAEEVVAHHLTDVQASLNTSTRTVVLTFTLSVNAYPSGVVTTNRTVNIILRNVNP